MDNIMKDDRFAHMIKDPKYRRIPKNVRKVKIDKRFKSMFEDKKFSVNYTVDKRGKPVVQTSKENLRKYYNLSDSESEASDEITPDADCKEVKSPEESKIENKEKSHIESSDEEKSHDESSDEEEGEELSLHESSDTERNKDSHECNSEESKQLPLKKKKKKTKISQDIKKKLRSLSVDYARGEGLLVSESSSDEESFYNSESGEEICHDWGEFDKDAEETVEVTRRLAACNMDWDHMRAVDLMVSLHSFLPSGGLIHSVTIYPSEYGLKRMKEEEINGPPELVNDSFNGCDEENEEGSSYHMEKLRQYQLNRLKYYYAVIECDRPETADKLWSECRNVEYESTGLKYDLRFIPDDMTFDQTPKEVCDKMPNFSTYQPRVFTTTALQQEKVDLSWDETNIERKELTEKINSGKLDELNENHIQSLLASGSSESESDAEGTVNENEDGSDSELKGNSIQKYKLLLQSIEKKEEEEKEKDVELECTWGFNVKDSSHELEKNKKEKTESLTPFEKYLEKRKEKQRVKRKCKNEKNVNQSDEVSENEEYIPSGIDLKDPYFAEELKSCKTKKAKKSDKARLSSENEQNGELELVLMEENEEGGKQHFSMKKIEENESCTKSKKKRLKRKHQSLSEEQEDNFKINVNDPRFHALFTSHHFNIDPTNPHFRKTKATETLINETLKRRNKMIK